MRLSKRPYAPPRKLERELARVLVFWNGLKRREAEIPFWDDVKLSALPELSGKLMMIEVLANPVRFRFSVGLVGEEINRQYGDLFSMFLDEIEIRYPFQFLLSQCSATIESRAPTYYRHSEARGGSHSRRAFSRLLLPLWGNGRIGMLLGAFAWE